MTSLLAPTVNSRLCIVPPASASAGCFTSRTAIHAMCRSKSLINRHRRLWCRQAFSFTSCLRTKRLNILYRQRPSFHFGETHLAYFDKQMKSFRFAATFFTGKTLSAAFGAKATPQVLLRRSENKSDPEMSLQIQPPSEAEVPSGASVQDIEPDAWMAPADRQRRIPVFGNLKAEICNSMPYYFKNVLLTSNCTSSQNILDLTPCNTIAPKGSFVESHACINVRAGQTVIHFALIM